MKLQQGQFIQIRFNNGVFFDAIVEEWSDQKSIVKLADTNEIVIIQKTLQDVLLVKVLAVKNEPIVKQQYKSEVDEEFETLKAQPKNNDTLARMAELKDELNKIEREELLKKTLSHKPSGLKEVTYGIPRHIQVSSAAQHTEQKIASTNSQLNSELSKLFGQKH
jgi:tetrahydromethanopterin S-methyltransferase subunit A